VKGLGGKVAIITGGAKGIGYATARALAERGAVVVLADIDAAAGAAAEASLTAGGAEAGPRAADVSDETAIAELVEQVRARFGRLDVLVNCAARFVIRGLDADARVWHEAFLTSVFGYALCAKHAVPVMRAGGGGAIVHVSSISALVAQPEYLTYSAGKGALLSMTKCMALDLAPDRIRVNAVCPGTIWTSSNEAFVRETAGLDRAGADADPDIGGRHMLGRTGDPEEVGEAIAFLASESASFITGTSLVVDGGYVAQ
jgi:NAD(P)-dependent dehydrogenase (short-subunit alcohol dehydrogenase family)